MNKLETALQTATPIPMQQLNPETGELTTIDNIHVAPVEVDPYGFDFDALENATTSVSMIPVYWSPTEKNQKLRGFYQGTMTITKNDAGQMKDIEVIRLLTRDALYMQGGAIVVDYFKDIPVGSPVELIFLGKKKTANGHNANDFDVRLLRI